MALIYFSNPCFTTHLTHHLSFSIIITIITIFILNLLAYNEGSRFGIVYYYASLCGIEAPILSYSTPLYLHTIDY